VTLKTPRVENITKAKECWASTRRSVFQIGFFIPSGKRSRRLAGSCGYELVTEKEHV
jgi:hypothetical protein